jgi:hypothetical protein
MVYTLEFALIAVPFLLVLFNEDILLHYKITG